MEIRQSYDLLISTMGFPIQDSIPILNQVQGQQQSWYSQRHNIHNNRFFTSTKKDFNYPAQTCQHLISEMLNDFEIQHKICLI